MKFRRPRLTQDQKIAIVTDYASDMPIEEIRKRHNVSRQTIYNILHEVADKVEDYGKN